MRQTLAAVGPTASLPCRGDFAWIAVLSEDVTSFDVNVEAFFEGAWISIGGGLTAVGTAVVQVHPQLAIRANLTALVIGGGTGVDIALSG